MIWEFFNNSTWDFNYEEHDWEKLKKEGTVTETIEEKNGFRTITKTFVSFDGITRITSTESYPIINENSEKLKELNKKIQEAVKKENYEEAAKLKIEKDKLLEKPKESYKSKIKNKVNNSKEKNSKK